MSANAIFLGTDSGATTSKTNGVRADGSVISPHLHQRRTNAAAGTAAVIAGWLEGAEAFLQQHGHTWGDVAGVGLAIPGPYQAYGVLDKSANLPASFAGWDVRADYSRAIAERAGREIPLVVGNDGNLGGVAEAHRVRGNRQAGVLMLAPGSGLGAAYIDPQGLPLDGDTFAGMEGGHMPAPLQLLGSRPYRCGCGREWGCVEVYTTLSGLPYLLEEHLERFPDHELARSPLPPKEKVLALRTLAQKGDELALAIFDFQAKALGLHVANLVIALDATFVVIGGGLIDPEATTPEFRARYLKGIDDTARPLLWPVQRARVQIVPATLGELSQAIGAALVARHYVANR